MKKPLMTIIYAIIIFLFISLWGFYLAIRPFKITSSITPQTFGVAYENIAFKTKDHITIRGWFIKNPNPHAKTIILLHGYPADKGDILPSTLFLHDKYNLLYLDFRYLGTSEGFYTSLGKNEVLDLLGAIQFLKERNIKEVGVWGFSLGGAVALMTAPNAPEIKAIIAESSYARLDWMAYDYYRIPLFKYVLGELTRFWGLVILNYDIKKISPAQSAKEIKIPVLIIHSKHDNVISFENALLIEQSLSHNTQAQFIYPTKLLHGQLLQNHDKVLQKFFDDNL